MRIVTIGGGTGQFALLSALKNIPGIEISAIVSMVDSGGSTGKLRDEYGVLPPGDVLKCLIALSPYKDARDILQTRFESGKLKNHNAGNLLLVFLSQYLGNDFRLAIEELGRILNIKGKVLPVTTDKATLVAELENGQMIFSESEIDLRGSAGLPAQAGKIKKTFLVPHSGRMEINPEAENAIEKADYIFIGPGDLFTSITPNFLVPGVAESFRKSKAKIVYILNIMTKYAETNGFTAKDFVEKIEKYLGRRVDCVLANDRRPQSSVMKKYKKEKARLVEIDLKSGGSRKIIAEDLITDGELARHDVKKLNDAILNRIFK